MTAPIIRIDRINKSFGKFEVLKDLSFDVLPGEKLALIGPSGSGKTTILRILMTLKAKNSGTITIDNEPLWHMQRGDALVPGLQVQRFDMVAAGLFIKPERCEAVAFSQPDLCDAESFMVKRATRWG